MKIAILGYGAEGKSVEQYFKNEDITIFNHFTPSEFKNLPLDKFDLVFRSPSVPILEDFFQKPPSISSLKPKSTASITDLNSKNTTGITMTPPTMPKNWTTSTRYFFDHCPATIIGVTGTKGKGTTCSLIQAIFNQLGYKTHLIGNIGTPALDRLDDIKKTDIVIYELSSFQLWDLEKSPHISVVLRIEPDHLDVHHGFNDYVSAKSHITAYQKPEDYCIFYQHNHYSTEIASLSHGKKIPYSLDQITENTPSIPQLYHILENLSIPGLHNRENALAALLAVSSFNNLSLEDFITEYTPDLITAFKNFKGLPHRLEFIRTLNSVNYYDDNYSSAYSALDVALSALENQPIFLIAGGKDRGLDLENVKNRLKTAKNLEKIFFIGETKNKLAEDLPTEKYELHNSLNSALVSARTAAENFASTRSTNVNLLMSPGAASFDMFKNFSDRGTQFQSIVRSFK